MCSRLITILVPLILLDRRRALLLLDRRLPLFLDHLQLDILALVIYHQVRVARAVIGADDRRLYFRGHLQARVVVVVNEATYTNFFLTDVISTSVYCGGGNQLVRQARNNLLNRRDLLKGISKWCLPPIRRQLP